MKTTINEAEELIKGVKGFNTDMTCQGFQYKEGETFKTDKAPIRCTNNGFHFCENPLDVFRYYPPSTSVYLNVEGSGQVDRKPEDSKIAVSQIKIGGSISLAGMIKFGIEYILRKVDKDKAKQTSSGDNSTAASSGDNSTAASSGYRSTAASSGDSSTAASSGDSSTAASSGYRSTAASSGDNSTAASSGYRSTAKVTGKDSIAVANGVGAMAKASLGSWIVLTEYGDDGHIINVKSAKIDGKKLKADTLYTLKGGKFAIAQ